MNKLEECSDPSIEKDYYPDRLTESARILQTKVQEACRTRTAGTVAPDHYSWQLIFKTNQNRAKQPTQNEEVSMDIKAALLVQDLRQDFEVAEVVINRENIPDKDGRGIPPIKGYYYRIPPGMTLKAGDDVIVTVRDSSSPWYGTVRAIHTSDILYEVSQDIHYKWVLSKLDVAAYNTAIALDETYAIGIRKAQRTARRMQAAQTTMAEFKSLGITQEDIPELGQLLKEVSTQEEEK